MSVRHHFCSWVACCLVTSVAACQARDPQRLSASMANALETDQTHAVIIRTPKPYTGLVRAIEEAGGIVTFKYNYIDAVAARLPEAALKAVRPLVGAAGVIKDSRIPGPSLRQGERGMLGPVAAQATSMELPAPAALDGASGHPASYLINAQYTNVAPVFLEGYRGEGMTVAVIDSGYRPGFPHLELDGSVIGGEDFVKDGLSWSNWDNNPHGTFVAGMISGNVLFRMPPTSPLLQSIQNHCPSCVVEGNGVPILGTAPSSSIYMLRSIAPENFAYTSWILGAMERVIQLRENYENGIPETRSPDGSYAALDIRVCNMSLTGLTLWAGRDLFDLMTEKMLEHDILPVVAAANSGPSGTTGGTPGTGRGALTVGAASTPVHARVYLDIAVGPGLGSLYRPFEGVQTAFFSSRGPVADGRTDPDVVANGLGSFSQGYFDSVDLVAIGWGTSFASPTVAGVAALLWQAVPGATARQIRNAIILGANPDLLNDGSGPLDQGAGFVDAAAALQLLRDGTVPVGVASKEIAQKKVRQNVDDLVDMVVGQSAARRYEGLMPGQRGEIFFDVKRTTSAVSISVFDVVPGEPQNLLFGDDVLLTVHSAKTSCYYPSGDYPVWVNTTGGTFVIPNPEPGLLRVTVNGDWTNASPISASIRIEGTMSPEPKRTASGTIADGQAQLVWFTVPEGTTTLDARLWWRNGWDRYPTNDVDFYLFDPIGQLASTSGVSLDMPENASIESPLAGQWAAYLYGYTVYTGADKFELRATADGNVLEADGTYTME